MTSNSNNGSLSDTALAEAVTQFENDGFAIIKNFLNDHEVEEMRKQMSSIVGAMDPKQHPKSVFQTVNHNQHTQDEYFLNSSDKIRFFYEDGAVDKDGKLKVDKSVAFNKVGHGLHFLDPVFKRITFSEKFKKLIRAVGYKKPTVVQSMYIFKQPKIGGEVTPHYDATFLYVEPIEHLLGVWIPMEDATLENGCLWFIPGSHKIRKVDYRFVRTHTKNGTDPLVKFVGEQPKYDETAFVPVPVAKGSCVLIHGLAWHKSDANKSDKSRHAYTLHVTEMENTVWSPDNWLQQTEEHKFPNLYDTPAE